MKKKTIENSFNYLILTIIESTYELCKKGWSKEKIKKIYLKGVRDCLSYSTLKDLVLKDIEQYLKNIDQGVKNN